MSFPIRNVFDFHMTTNVKYLVAFRYTYSYNTIAQHVRLQMPRDCDKAFLSAGLETWMHHIWRGIIWNHKNS